MRLAFLHTSPLLAPLFSQLARERLPGVGVFHMVDESLIQNTIAAGRLTKQTIRRLVALAQSAHEGGSDAVMVTCSSIGPAVRVARELLDFPIFRIDEPMAHEAVRRASRIGVAATLETTLEPTMDLLKSAAREAGKPIEVVPRLCADAFASVLDGDTERHDALLAEALGSLMEEVELVVLAQASMARVVSSLPPNSVPVLSSPELAVEYAAKVLLARLRAAKG